MAMQSFTADVLPHEVLMRVLQHVPLNHRLACCGRVSTTWREAAAQATTAIAGQLCSEKALQAVQQGLASVGQHVTKISLGNPSCMYAPSRYGQLRQLPYPHLQDLALCGFDYLYFGQNDAGLLSQATSLTRLHLAGRSMEYPPIWIGVPAALSALTCLKALSGLLHLHTLEVEMSPYGTAYIERDDLKHIWQLTQLRSLTLRGVKGVITGRDVLYLPAKTPGAPSLAQLTALQRLCLTYGGGFNPVLLVGMTQLQSLELGVQLTSDPVTPYNMLLRQAGTLALLSNALPQLQALTSLTLTGALAVVCGGAHTAHFSALTSTCSNLRRLVLRDDILQCDVFTHIFPNGRMLPHLTELQLVNMQAIAHRGNHWQGTGGAYGDHGDGPPAIAEEDAGGYDDDDEDGAGAGAAAGVMPAGMIPAVGAAGEEHQDVGDDHPPPHEEELLLMQLELQPQPCLGAQEMQRIARACPNLCSLDVDGSINPSVFPVAQVVQPLLQLPGLTHLCLNHIDDEVAGRVLQRLKQLRSLCVSGSNITPISVLGLAPLHNLTTLIIYGDLRGEGPFSYDLQPGDTGYDFVVRNGQGLPGLKMFKDEFGSPKQSVGGLRLCNCCSPASYIDILGLDYSRPVHDQLMQWCVTHSAACRLVLFQQNQFQAQQRRLENELNYAYNREKRHHTWGKGAPTSGSA